MKTNFYLDGKIIQELELSHIPRVGELVRFDFDYETLYLVKIVVHRYFAEGDYILIHLQETE